jgi:S1-C subfamily serine protease
MELIKISNCPPPRHQVTKKAKGFDYGERKYPISKGYPKPQLTILLYLGLALLFPALSRADDETLKKSVVKVFSTMQNVDFYEPWKSGSQVHLQGCGSVIPGDRILTTAHLVNKANYIEVQKSGETKRYVAKVEQLGFDLDLAVLTLEDKDFFKDALPVEFGGLPLPGDKIKILGGEDLSIKDDTVSALDMVWTSEGARYVPAILTNGAIDANNYGCPVFSGGKFIGIPFDSQQKPDKTGSVLPVNVIQRFFTGFKNGKTYDGFPDLGFYYQELDSSSLRSYYKLSPAQTGVVITKVIYGGSADGLLKEEDILTAIDGHPIDNEGNITLRKGERIDLSYLITFYLTEEETSLDILRDGRPQKIKIPLKPISRLIPWREDNRHPTYFMLAGFVFAPLTGNYFQSANWESFKPELRELYYHGLPSEDRKEVVLISHVLPHEINTGYDKQANLIVKKVNGRPIKEMKDLLTALENPTGKYHVIEVDDHTWFGSTIVFDAETAKQATEEIMNSFKISSDRSQDLK